MTIEQKKIRFQVKGSEDDDFWDFIFNGYEEELHNNFLDMSPFLDSYVEERYILELFEVINTSTKEAYEEAYGYSKIINVEDFENFRNAYAQISLQGFLAIKYKDLPTDLRSDLHSIIINNNKQ